MAINLRDLPDVKNPRDLESFLKVLKIMLGQNNGIGWLKIDKTGSSLGDLQNRSSDLLVEGTTNIFYTVERVSDDCNAIIIIPASDALTKTFNDANNTISLSVTKIAAMIDAASSGVSVTSADADATYSVNEENLINELKGDVNQLVSDFNALVNKFNTHLAGSRTANQMLP